MEDQEERDGPAAEAAGPHLAVGRDTPVKQGFRILLEVLMHLSDNYREMTGETNLQMVESIAALNVVIRRIR